MPARAPRTCWLLATGSATAWRTYRHRPGTMGSRSAVGHARRVAHVYLDGIERTLGGSQISFQVRRNEQGQLDSASAKYSRASRSIAASSAEQHPSRAHPHPRASPPSGSTGTICRCRCSVLLTSFRALGALRSLIARLTRAAKADHITLNERTQRANGMLMSQAFLHAAVAPSRRIRQVRLTSLPIARPRSQARSGYRSSLSSPTPPASGSPRSTPPDRRSARSSLRAPESSRCCGSSSNTPRLMPPGRSAPSTPSRQRSTSRCARSTVTTGPRSRRS